MRYVVLGAVVMVALLIWQITSVGRGARRRDQRLLKLLDPLAGRLQRREPPDPDEVRKLAEQAPLRGMLRLMLEHFGRLDLFPPELDTRRHHAETLLAHWMMHPNELRAAPAAMELVETVSRSVASRDAEFLVFRFRMEPGHWAGGAWLLGLAGPFFEGDAPYSECVATAWALSTDKADETSPGAIVDRFLKLFEKSAGGWAAA